VITTSRVVAGKTVPQAVVLGEYLIAYTERGVEPVRMVLT